MLHPHDVRRAADNAEGGANARTTELLTELLDILAEELSLSDDTKEKLAALYRKVQGWDD